MYWIEGCKAGRLAIMPRPRSGDWLEDEIIRWRDEKTAIIVSLLEAEETRELRLEAEANLCSMQGMQFISFPIRDRGVPDSAKDFATLIRSLNAVMAEGKAIAVHCRAGIGRSALLAACILIASGFTAQSALRMIAKARGLQVPDTDEQKSWIEAFTGRL